MEIINQQLKDNEVEWLTTLLDDERITCRDEIIKQINSAKIDREYTKYYLFLNFYVNEDTDKICVSTRVPYEMRAYISNEAPIQFLLHFIGGYIYKLEVFRADSSEINRNYALKNYQKLEYVFG